MELLELFGNEVLELTEIENSRLENCETIIRHGIRTFKEVGQALLEIRDSRLYRKDYNTFDDYCLEKWDITKTHVNRMIQAKIVNDNLTPIGVKPSTENQLRPLSKLEPELQRMVWQEATETTEKPTGQIIKELVSKKEGLNEIIKELKTSNQFVFATEKEFIETAIKILRDRQIPTTDPDIEVRKELDNTHFKMETLQKEKNYLSKTNDEKHQEILRTAKELQQLNIIRDKKEALEKEVKKLRELNLDENKIMETMKQINEYEKRALALSSTIRISDKMASAIVEAEDFFKNHMILLSTLTVTEDAKENVKDWSNELVYLVENWLFAFKSKFLESQEQTNLIKL